MAVLIALPGGVAAPGQAGRDRRLAQHLMILPFLGGWRSTPIVCISISLSILVSLIVLRVSGQTINIMNPPMARTRYKVLRLKFVR